MLLRFVCRGLLLVEVGLAKLQAKGAILLCFDLVLLEKLLECLLHRCARFKFTHRIFLILNLNYQITSHGVYICHIYSGLFLDLTSQATKLTLNPLFVFNSPPSFQLNYLLKLVFLPLNNYSLLIHCFFNHVLNSLYCWLLKHLRSQISNLIG